SPEAVNAEGPVTQVAYGSFAALRQLRMSAFINALDPPSLGRDRHRLRAILTRPSEGAKTSVMAPTSLAPRRLGQQAHHRETPNPEEGRTPYSARAATSRA